MSLFQSAVLGIVQGIAEFLPISSSAHLILIPWLLGWDDGGLTFDVALHAGTLVAILVYFRKEWIEMFKALLKLRLHHLKELQASSTDANLRLAVFVIIGTIPGAIMGLLLEKKAEHAFRNPGLIAFNLAIMGAILWFADSRGKHEKTVENLKLSDVLFVGIAQGFSVIPGVSRAGVTITAALFKGFGREAAAKFSFYLSMPIIAGACILKLRHLAVSDFTPAFITGILLSAVAGFLAISGLISFLQKRSYSVFAIYRMVVGLIVIFLVLSGHTT